MSYDKLIDQVNLEYEQFKVTELQKSPEQLFQDAFKISTIEQLLWMLEHYLCDFETHIPNLCDKLLQTEDVLEYIYLETLSYEYPIVDKEDFGYLLKDLFT